MNLLKILQDNWESVFDPFEAVKLQYENSEIR